MKQRVINLIILVTLLSCIFLFFNCDYNDPVSADNAQVAASDEIRDEFDKSVQKPKIDIDCETVIMSTEGDGDDKSPTSYITNLYVILGSSSSITPPTPYIKINYGVLSYGNGDLNQGAGGKYIYLCYTRDSVAGSPIRGLRIYSGSGSTCYPPTHYYHVSNSDGYSAYGSRGADLNKGAGGDYIYLFATKYTGIGLPIRQVGIISTGSRLYYPPSGWNWLSNDLNKGAGGKYIYLLYKY